MRWRCDARVVMKHYHVSRPRRELEKANRLTISGLRLRLELAVTVQGSGERPLGYGAPLSLWKLS